MNSSPNTSIQSITEFEHFLNRLSENDLRLLNRMVVERLNLYRKMNDLKNLSKFNLMDKVVFKHEGQNISGVILKLNRRSVTVRATNGQQWIVAPILLTRLH